MGSHFSGTTATERVEGTVDELTDDAVYVSHNGDNRAMAATVNGDELEMNPDVQDAKFGPPPIPLDSSFVGDAGNTHSGNCASVALYYSPDDGWYLGASNRGVADGISAEIYHQQILEFTLMRTSRIVLCQDDRDHFVEPLGADLPQLLTRIAAGHSDKHRVGREQSRRNVHTRCAEGT